MPKIAYGRSSKAKAWSNRTVEWPDLVNRLQSTYRTAETMEEYKRMSRAEKDAIKDRGGFVGGHLKDGRRLVKNVECRSMLTLDGDNAEPGFIARFESGCEFAAVLYTTHGHTPQAPRVRIIIPFTEDISPDCYIAVARYYAAEWGIDQFDPCSFRVNQMMYWPTTSSDGEYICRVIDKPFMDARAFLSKYPGWHDCSKLPVTAREKQIPANDRKMQEDPLTKDGIVGTFCRTYTIQAAIAKFLPDVYAESAVDGRYDYIPGEGSAGVLVYDDKFAYSHHATDPAGGKLLNAFDLVRIHRFGEDDDKTSFLKMCALAEEDELVKEVLEREQLAQAKADFEESDWEEPIPFGRYDVKPFPVDALPPDISAYVEAVSESTQTPVDMAGTAVLALLSVCLQGKYVIQGKPDWTEPMNLFVNIIAEPSERKSAVLGAMTKPLDNFEERYNKQNAARVVGSKIRRLALERRQKAIEDKIAKGQAKEGELEQIAQEIASFVEEQPLKLYVDDITTEKLISVMAANHGHAALISSEGGIFDTLAGIYTRNVNIDVMLKGYSGDTIRVDRIGRESESVMNPALTVLLMAQPKVISEVLSNATFRGRGLTARFLYCLPTSFVGTRKFQSTAVTADLYRQYERKMVDMLEEEHPPRPEVITLSSEAFELLAGFAEELEPKLKTDYAEVSDWAGKLAGNTLRIAGLLCRASVYRAADFLSDNEPLTVDKGTMANAIRLGQYYLNHALAVYDVIPESNMQKQAKMILQMIDKKHLTEFTRRDAMRNCRVFKTADEVQLALNFLDDYGYIIRQPSKAPVVGRPPLSKYTVNPAYLAAQAPKNTKNL